MGAHEEEVPLAIESLPRAAVLRASDAASDAIREAYQMVVLVMQERGYPMENFEQRSSDVSVDHREVVENYRAAMPSSLANGITEASATARPATPCTRPGG